MLTRISITELSNKSTSPNSLTFNGDADFIITIFPHATDDGVHIEYGEVKPINTASNHYLVNWDLVRLAMFGKHSIDEHDLVGNLSIHVVAPNIIYYLIRLTTDGMYTMTELLRIQIPMSISELSGYAANISKLKDVLSAFELYCMPKHKSNNNNNEI